MAMDEHDGAVDEGTSGRRVAWIVWAAATVLLGAYLVGRGAGLIPDARFGIAEAVALAAILVLNPTVVARLQTFSVSPKGLEFKLEQVEVKQDRLGQQVRGLQWVFAHLLTDYELRTLRRIAGPKEDDSYDMSDAWDVRSYLRALRGRRLIAMRNAGQFIAHLPEKGQLREYFVLTSDGRDFLDLADQIARLGRTSLPEGRAPNNGPSTRSREPSGAPAPTE
jgi:hypothetical protein